MARVSQQPAATSHRLCRDPSHLADCPVRAHAPPSSPSAPQNQTAPQTPPCPSLRPSSYPYRHPSLRSFPLPPPPPSHPLASPS
eukprot:6214124-Pleurochrysis_carterae.AAC.1